MLLKKTKVKNTAAKKTGSLAKHAELVRPRRSAEVILNRIVHAAAEEFKRCGYAGTTTAAIARAADVTQAQLFRYFDSKSDIFLETIFKPLDQQLMNFIDQYKPNIGDSAKRRRSAGQYTKALQHFISENAGMLTSLVVAQIYDSGAAHGVAKIRSLAAYFDHGASMMKCQIQGKARVDPRIMVRLSFIAVLGTVMFKNWIFPEELAQDEELESALTIFIMEGVGANGPR
jgi:AcrR family transcriptional regulator